MQRKTKENTRITFLGSHVCVPTGRDLGKASTNYKIALSRHFKGALRDFRLNTRSR